MVKYDRIGLTAEQVARYEIEPRDPKPSEHPGMINFVAECAEVDFLRSEQIQEIVRDGIEAHITDRDAYRATLAREAAERAALSDLAQRWGMGYRFQE